MEMVENSRVCGGLGQREVSAMLIQPFINYNFSGGMYLTSAPIITADWETPSSQHRWTVPVGGGVGKLWRVGKVGCW